MALARLVSLDRKYRTVSGRLVRIYAVDAGGEYPVHGAVRSSGEWGIESWTEFGSSVDGESCTYDLVEIPDPPAFDTTKQWMRADVPWPRPEFRRLGDERSNWLIPHWICCDGIGFDGVGFVDWKSLAADWQHSIDGGKTWHGCEVPA